MHVTRYPDKLDKIIMATLHTPIYGNSVGKSTQTGSIISMNNHFKHPHHLATYRAIYRGQLSNAHNLSKHALS